MIKSLLDTDFYKLTMMQAVLHHYPSAIVRYEFKWRNWDKMNLNIELNDFRRRLIKDGLSSFCELSFKDEELDYLSAIPFFKPDFIDYLALYTPNCKYIQPHIHAGELRIRIEGPWVQTILFETPVLAMISELYTRHNNIMEFSWQKDARRVLANKIDFLKNALHRDNNFKFVDFGTRRRAALLWHKEVLTTLQDSLPNNFIGTSNVMFAMQLGLKPIGTMAHEWLQAHQQLGVRLVDSQAAAMQTWANEYRGELGIALSDVVGFDNFLKDFDRYFALLFDGCRHDSGDPEWWCEKLINHYKALRIDPKSKAAVFSDGLTMPIAVDLYKRFNSQINTSFGIGTHLTNDCGFTAPQIVIKLVDCNGKPTAKISDSKGKGMCEDSSFLEYLNKVMREK